MHIPEGEPFEVPKDHTGQEKSFTDVMGKGNAFSPDNLFANQPNHIPYGSKAPEVPRDQLPKEIRPVDRSKLPNVSVRPNYEEFDPYKNGNRERVIMSYGNLSASPELDTGEAPTEPTKVFSED